MAYRPRGRRAYAPSGRARGRDRRPREPGRSDLAPKYRAPQGLVRAIPGAQGAWSCQDRKSVVEGNSVDLGGARHGKEKAGGTAEVYARLHGTFDAATYRYQA